MRQADVTFIPCSTFGGGWAVGDTEVGRDWLEAFFNDAPAYLMPIDDTGWIVEPQDVGALVETARDQCIRIALQ